MPSRASALFSAPDLRAGEKERRSHAELCGPADRRTLAAALIEAVVTAFGDYTSLSKSTTARE
jgi:hypothetical protein